MASTSAPREVLPIAYNCLIARRLLVRGTWFVQLMRAGWDQHGNLFTQLEQQCRDTDAPTAALMQDLKERGASRRRDRGVGGDLGRTPFRAGRSGQPQEPRPLRQGLFVFPSGRRRKAGPRARIDQRLRLEHPGRPGPHSRPAGDDPAPGGDRPYEAHLPLSGPPVSLDRRAWACGEGDAGVTRRSIAGGAGLAAGSAPAASRAGLSEA